RNRWRLKIALDCFEQAIARDASYAEAWAGVADCHMVMGAYSVKPGHELLRDGAAAAARALSLAPKLSEAHHSLGAVKLFLEWDWAGAEASLRRAIELNPRAAMSHVYLGLLLGCTSRSREGLAELDIALGLEPDSPVVTYVGNGGLL